MKFDFLHILAIVSLLYASIAIFDKSLADVYWPSASYPSGVAKCVFSRFISRTFLFISRTKRSTHWEGVKVFPSFAMLSSKIAFPVAFAKIYAASFPDASSIPLRSSSTVTTCPFVKPALLESAAIIYTSSPIVTTSFKFKVWSTVSAVINLVVLAGALLSSAFFWYKISLLFTSTNIADLAPTVLFISWLLSLYSIGFRL